MLDVLVDGLSWLALVAGSFVVVVGALGLVRMPDVFTRMHAGGMIDTLGAALIFLGLILQAGLSLVALKLVVLFALFFITSPVATHALARAALYAGVEPKLAEDRDIEHVPADYPVGLFSRDKS
ncbi:MAG: monovalent cation/H(+) antiporter subunit G [Hyphomicrobiaceae bacterium]